MISGHRKLFEFRLLERGYTLDEVRPCIVSEHGDLITVDPNHPAARSRRSQGLQPMLGASSNSRAPEGGTQNVCGGR